MEGGSQLWNQSFRPKVASPNHLLQTKPLWWCWGPSELLLPLFLRYVSCTPPDLPVEIGRWRWTTGGTVEITFVALETGHDCCLLKETDIMECWVIGFSCISSKMLFLTSFFCGGHHQVSSRFIQAEMECEDSVYRSIRMKLYQERTKYLNNVTAYFVYHILARQ